MAIYIVKKESIQKYNISNQFSYVEIYNCKSFKELATYMEEKRTIKGFPGGKVHSGDAIEEPCDILVLSSMEKTVTKKNVDKLKAKVRNRHLYFNLACKLYMQDSNSCLIL